MNELQISLIGLGALFVVAVVGYNKWQERKHRSRSEAAFGQTQADPLMAETIVTPAARKAVEAYERVEPVWQAPEEGVEALQETEAAQAAEASARESASGAGGYALPPEEAGAAENVAQALPIEWMTPDTDFIVTFEAVDPIPAKRIHDLLEGPLAALDKPVRWLGLDEQAGAWQRVSADTKMAFHRMAVGLQLVDRHGPLGDASLNQFIQVLQGFADEALAVCEMPERKPLLAQAEALDRFCAGVDIQIGINILAGAQPFAGTKLRGLAEAHGFVLANNGVFERRDDQTGQLLFVLANHDPAPFTVDSLRGLSCAGLTLLLDLPRVAQGERVFDRMLETARQLADALRGQIVDDHRQPLDARSIGLIREQVVHYQKSMAEQGVIAGSALALRLFV